LFHEADILTPPDLLAEVLSAGREVDVVRPATWVWDLDPDSSEVVHQSGHPGLRALLRDRWTRRTAPGGSLAIRRGSFEKLRGFNEQFQAWGADDEEFLLRVRHLCRCVDLAIPLHHLWHESRKHEAEHVANRLLLSYASSFTPDRVDEYVASLPTSFGDEHAFDPRGPSR
jgi:hypothetical protein